MEMFAGMAGVCVFWFVGCCLSEMLWVQKMRIFLVAGSKNENMVSAKVGGIQCNENKVPAKVDGIQCVEY